MIELELTYLAKTLPDNLFQCESKKIIDLYVENGTDHADLRIRKNGDRYELTRKIPTSDQDYSKQEETTIDLAEAEFNSLLNVSARKVEKTRYFYPHSSHTAEFDVFESELDGLVVIDFEFGNEEEQNNFQMPDFCLADVTQEKFIAGGVLAGKKYDEIEDELNRFSYQKIAQA